MTLQRYLRQTGALYRLMGKIYKISKKKKPGPAVQCPGFCESDGVTVPNPR